jgi:hypothetical protein
MNWTDLVCHDDIVPSSTSEMRLRSCFKTLGT